MLLATGFVIRGERMGLGKEIKMTVGQEQWLCDRSGLEIAAVSTSAKGSR